MFPFAFIHARLNANCTWHGMTAQGSITISYGTLGRFFYLPGLSFLSNRTWQPHEVVKIQWMLRMNCVPPQFLCWSPNPQCDSIWRWGLWELSRFRWRHKGRFLAMGSAPLQPESVRVPPSQTQWGSSNRKSMLPRIQPATPWCWTS